MNLACESFNLHIQLVISCSNNLLFVKHVCPDPLGKLTLNICKLLLYRHLAESRRLLVVAKKKEKDYEARIDEAKLALEAANAKSDQQLKSIHQLTQILSKLQEENKVRMSVTYFTYTQFFSLVCILKYEQLKDYSLT